jgi:RHS repeat-associated protein
VQTNEVYYIYDGNVVIQERTSSSAPTVTYTRGNDLSGTLQGAGGIGGLLARTDNVAQQTAFYHADGNGNVTMLVNSYQAAVAKYLYDAFGNTLSLSGPLAYANLYRFSSKETHQNSGLIYYLYRYYDPNLQRWANRDPLGELGLGILWTRSDEDSVDGDWPNLYGFVLNNPVGFTDSLGLEVYKSCKEDKTQGGFKPTRSDPTGVVIHLPFGGTADQMRVVQRKCNFRCYHKNIDNCYKIPCTDKSCKKDHGVSIQVTVNATGSGAAATCKDIASEVRSGTITGGSIARNHVEVLW